MVACKKFLIFLVFITFFFSSVIVVKSQTTIIPQCDTICNTNSQPVCQCGSSYCGSGQSCCGKLSICTFSFDICTQVCFGSTTTGSTTPTTQATTPTTALPDCGADCQPINQECQCGIGHCDTGEFCCRWRSSCSFPQDVCQTNCFGGSTTPTTGTPTTGIPPTTVFPQCDPNCGANNQMCQCGFDWCFPGEFCCEPFDACIAIQEFCQNICPIATTTTTPTTQPTTPTTQSITSTTQSTTPTTQQTTTTVAACGVSGDISVTNLDTDGQSSNSFNIDDVIKFRLGINVNSNRQVTAIVRDEVWFDQNSNGKRDQGDVISRVVYDGEVTLNPGSNTITTDRFAIGDPAGKRVHVIHFETLPFDSSNLCYKGRATGVNDTIGREEEAKAGNIRFHDDGTSFTVQLSPTQLRINCTACNAGTRCNCTFSEICNSGVWSLTNQEGTPLNLNGTPKSVSGPIPPSRIEFIPNSTGKILVEAVCSNPSKHNSTTLEVRERVLDCPTTCEVGKNCKCTVNLCNSGKFFAQNQEGTPLTNEINGDSFAGTYERTFQPSNTGKIAVRIICYNPEDKTTASPFLITVMSQATTTTLPTTTTTQNRTTTTQPTTPTTRLTTTTANVTQSTTTQPTTTKLECRDDSDCNNGFVCENGDCVQKSETTVTSGYNTGNTGGSTLYIAFGIILVLIIFYFFMKKKLTKMSYKTLHRKWSR
jgi:hypothetical protein